MLRQYSLPEILDTERQASSKQRLDIYERFEFCIKAIKSAQDLIQEGKKIECLGVHGILVDSVDVTGLKVNIGSYTYPNLPLVELSNKSFTPDERRFRDIKKYLISSTDDIQTANNEKTAVQLLGLLFLEIFRVFWIDQFDDRSKLIMEGKFPTDQPFKFGLRNVITKDCVDSQSESDLTKLLVRMCQIDPKKRPSLAEALIEFNRINDQKTMSLIPTFKPTSLDKNYAVLLGVIIEDSKRTYSDTLARYINGNYANLVKLLSQLSNDQLSYLEKYIKPFIKNEDLPKAWKQNEDQPQDAVETPRLRNKEHRSGGNAMTMFAGTGTSARSRDAARAAADPAPEARSNSTSSAVRGQVSQ